MYLVVSYPKSGATWFQFLMYHCYNQNFDTSKDIAQFYPPVRNLRQIRKNKVDKAISFAKSHDLPSQLNLTALKPKAIIYLLRNPLDVLASKINHHTNEGSLRLRFSSFKNKYINQQLLAEENYEIGSWNFHTRQWLTESHPYKIHLVKYEELIKNPFEQLSSLNLELNMELTKKEIERAVNKSSFESMKTIEKKEINKRIGGLFYSPKRYFTAKFLKTSFVNKGKVNNYRAVLRTEHVKRAKEAFRFPIEMINYSEL